MIFNKKEEKKPEKETSSLTTEERLDQGQVEIRAVLEVLGKPKEHVQTTLKSLVNQMKTTTSFTVENVKFSKAKAIDSMFSQFVEIEFWVKNINVMTGFCMDYMPSSIEMLNPNALKVQSGDFMGFLNDFMGKLHNLDMLVKNFRQQNNVLSANLVNLTKNMVRLLLVKSSKTAADIALVTGINPEGIGNVLTSLEKEGLIVKEGEKWALNPELRKDLGPAPKIPEKKPKKTKKASKK